MRFFYLFADHLECELVEADTMSDHSLPDQEMTNFKTDPTECDIEQRSDSPEITRFRPLTERERRSSNKFYHVKDDTSMETDSD